MLSESSLEIIKTSANQLAKPVRLALFTSERGCAACPDMLVLARTVKDHAKKIAMESYDLVMDRDKSEQYGITLVPAIALQGGKGETVTFSGRVEGGLLKILMNTIQFLSDTKQWVHKDVRRVLQKLAHDVTIRVFVNRDCPKCHSMAEAAIALALENRFIVANIIVAEDFPELVRKYSIKELPTTIFGEDLRREGTLAESEILEMVFEAEGIKPGPDRRCFVCSKSSQDVICGSCKTRIHAEAIDHKTRIEKGLKQP